jgi:hypothetical protein
MKHIQTYTLYENKTRQDLESELKHALYETQAGKDLLAINKITGMASESHKTWARFSYVKRGGATVFPAVETNHRGKNVPFGSPAISPTPLEGDIMWSWGYRPGEFSGYGNVYLPGGDFSTAEDCLRSLWEDLVLLICDAEIFPDVLIRKEHVELIKSNIKLFEGHAYDTEDLKFLITNLKDILSMQVKPNTANILRQRFPSLWQTMSDTPGITTFADLGELGF